MGTSHDIRGRAVRGRTILIAGVVALVAVPGLVSARDAERGFPIGQNEDVRFSEGLLQETIQELDKAADAKKKKAQEKLVSDADGTTQAFVRSMYAGTQQRLFGCNDLKSADQFELMERLDFLLELAPTGANNFVAAAGRVAERLREGMDGCSDEVAREFVKKIAKKAEALAKAAEKNPIAPKDVREGAAEIERLKRRVLVDERVYGCDAFSIYKLVKAIGIGLHRAEREPERAAAVRLIEKQIESTTELLELWRSCTSACEDRLDNDSDGVLDASDPGCLTGAGAAYDPDDESEQHFDPDADPPGIGCPTIPVAAVGPRNVFINQPNAGTTIIRHSIRNATTGEVLIERAEGDADFAAGGPVNVGAAVCGPGTTATIEWNVDGPDDGALDVNWTVRVSKANAGVAPQPNQIITAADTR